MKQISLSEEEIKVLLADLQAMLAVKIPSGLPPEFSRQEKIRLEIAKKLRDALRKKS